MSGGMYTCAHIHAYILAISYAHAYVHIHVTQVIHSTLGVAYLSIEWRDGGSGRVICFNLDKGHAGATAMKTRAAGPLAMNPQGGHVWHIHK